MSKYLLCALSNNAGQFCDDQIDTLERWRLQLLNLLLDNCLECHVRREQTGAAIDNRIDAHHTHQSMIATTAIIILIRNSTKVNVKRTLI